MAIFRYYINKTGTKIWIDIYNEPTDSKRYVLFKWNPPRSCLGNIPYCLARGICVIVEENKKLKPLSEQKTLKQQKHPIAPIENKEIIRNNKSRRNNTLPLYSES